ncbi:hypothetical protein ACJX0J_019360 [Zea mays]
MLLLYIMHYLFISCATPVANKILSIVFLITPSWHSRSLQVVTTRGMATLRGYDGGISILTTREVDLHDDNSSEGKRKEEEKMKRTEKKRLRIEGIKRRGEEEQE